MFIATRILTKTKAQKIPTQNLHGCPFFGGWEGWFHPKVYQVILSHDAQVEKIPGRWLDAWPSLAATIAGKSSQLKGDGSSKPSFVGGLLMDPMFVFVGVEMSLDLPIRKTSSHFIFFCSGVNPEEQWAALVSIKKLTTSNERFQFGVDHILAAYTRATLKKESATSLWCVDLWLLGGFIFAMS